MEQVGADLRKESSILLRIWRFPYASGSRDRIACVVVRCLGIIGLGTGWIGNGED